MTKKPFNSVVIPTEGYVVSQQTARFVHSLRLMDAVFNELYEAIDDLYGYKVAEDVMNNEFFIAYDSARSIIIRFLTESVDVTLSDLKNNGNMTRIEV